MASSSNVSASTGTDGDNEAFPVANNPAIASQVLAAARVIPADDDDKTPLWRKSYIFAANHQIGGYVPPSYNKLRTTLLAEEKINVERLLQPIKATWNSKGLMFQNPFYFG
ncbi:unnamed protein product [Urochloa humidicola]